MPVICDDYDLYFAHLPKSGGSFVEHFLRDEAGGRRFGPRHGSYRWAVPERQYSFRAFTVRQPLSWYQSYWSYARAATKRASAWPIWEAGAKSHPTHRLDQTGGAPTFERFIRKVLREFPTGYVRSMTCDFLNGSNVALRSEHLARDLEWLLADVGFARPEMVRDRPRANETPPEWKAKAVLPAELEAEIVEADNLEGLDIPYIDHGG